MKAGETLQEYRARTRAKRKAAADRVDAAFADPSSWPKCHVKALPKLYPDSAVRVPKPETDSERIQRDAAYFKCTGYGRQRGIVFGKRQGKWRAYKCLSWR